MRVDAHHLDIHVHRQHRDVRDRRKQQLLQPEHDLFHGPEPSRLGRFFRILVRADFEAVASTYIGEMDEAEASG
ncbi:hypothetical protein, partial [Streptomyces griseosporeus]|uniref:hypothetical protein n=1 Tax=Streptomyces griseosporeus TaxID=1910 RepID=UPI0036AC65CC